MAKIVVDRTRCSGIGLCEAVAPDLFEVDEGGDLVLLADEIAEGREDDIDDAVEGCPTQALSIEQ